MMLSGVFEINIFKAYKSYTNKLVILAYFRLNMFMFFDDFMSEYYKKNSLRILSEATGGFL